MMNNNNTTYKDSPLGKIPSEWQELKIKDVADIKGGYAFDSSNFKAKGKYQIIKMSNLYDNILDLNRSQSFLEDLSEQEKEFILKKDDIIITLTGTIGKRDYGYSFQINNENNLLLNQRLAKILVNKAEAKYLFYEIKTKRFLNQFFLSARGGTGNQANVGTQDLASLKIILPPLPEQKAIAYVLGLMDSAISTNNQLIAKKELQKKWLMQNLLTGKKRLKGYSEEWNEYKFKDCFHFIKSYSISRDGLSREQGKQYCIHYGDIHAYYDTDFIDFKNQSGIPKIIDNKVYVRPDDYLQDGDIIIADASEDYEGVGEAVEVINIQDKIVVGGLHTIVLRDFSGVASSLFRAYLFNSERVRNELRKKATGTSVYSVTKTTLESLVFKLPPLNEQSSIAMALQAADKEIQLLKAKTEKLREQKKGLMQVLLTGKKRLLI